MLQARFNRLDTYNNYRLPSACPSPAQNFEDITDRPEVVAVLKGLYGTPNEVEFYSGLFAETRVTKLPFPACCSAWSRSMRSHRRLPTRCSPSTFSTRPHSPNGASSLIHITSSLGDILSRNVPRAERPAVIMTQPTWVPEG